MNLVSIAMSLLTPAVVGRIATALGINPTLAQMAISAALPALLGGVAKKASNPAGLGTLTGLLGQQNPGMLSHLGELIGGSNQASLVQSGTGALTSLFGGQTTSALAGAVGKFSGVPEQASTGLLGMLAPVVLGSLAQQQKASNLDGPGLANLLAGQKDFIAQAMPAGFGELLKGTGLLGDAAPAAAPAAAAPAAAAPVVRAPVTPAAAKPAPAPAPSAAPMRRPDVEPSGGGLMRWLLPLAVLAALAFFGWQYFAKRGPVVTGAGPIMYENVDVGARATRLYENVKTNIGAIRDEASATATQPKLQEAADELQKLREIKEKLSPELRARLVELFKEFAPSLKGLIETAIKSIKPDSPVKPLLEQILRRMETIATT